ncbi:MAG TPA: Gfo/Idh/MocA family oxidoreductase [Acidimicrobiales bacterium]|nr:Gfo/Idh/MocA family oxidoreductase [Acidimicrobiales bacterium]
MGDAAPGVVVVATPPTPHADLAEEVIAAGRHVLVEKPFTPTVGDEGAAADLEGDALANITRFELGPATTQARILRALVTGAPPEETMPPATFVDGLALVGLMDAMRRSSAAGGAAVTVSPDR